MTLLRRHMPAGYFCNPLEEEEKAGCFSFVVLEIVLLNVNVMLLFLTVPWMEENV